MPRAWIVALFALFVVGCNKIVAAGGQHNPNPPTRVVSLSPSVTEIISSNGNNGQLVGRTESCNFPPYVKQLPVYGGVKPDYEKLAADPNISLVVYDATIYSNADIEKLKELKVPLFEFHAKNLDDYLQSMRDLGKKLECPMWMSTYLDKVTAAINNAKAQKPANSPKVAIMTGDLIDGTGSFVADVVTATGGKPVGPDADRFVASNPEQLIAENPDVVVLAADVSQFTDKDKQRQYAEQLLAKFANDPRHKSLAAVKSGHVFPVDADILLRQGSRVDRLIDAIGSIVRAGGTK